MTKNQYLMMCEQLGTEPKQEEIPYDFGDFPYDIQMALSIFYMLPDRWEGFSGTYMGKDYNILPYLVKVYNIDNDKQFLQYINMMNKIVVDIRAREQKARQAKQKSASKAKKR